LPEVFRLADQQLPHSSLGFQAGFRPQFAVKVMTLVQ
jgi:hypothetical protein